MFLKLLRVQRLYICHSNQHLKPFIWQCDSLQWFFTTLSQNSIPRYEELMSKYWRFDIQGYQLLHSVGVALVISVFGVSPRKEVTWVKIRRVGRPVSAMFIVLPIVQSSNVLSKMFIQKAEYWFVWWGLYVYMYVVI